MNLRETPFLRIVLPFILGIILYTYLPYSFFYFFCFFFFISFIFHLVLKDYQFHLLKGICINLLMIAAGLCISDYKNDYKSSKHYSLATEDTHLMALKLGKSKISKNSSTFEAEVLAINSADSTLQNASGKILISLSEIEEEIKTGDLIVVKGKSTSIKEPLNPHSFDFRKFYLNKEIGHRIYVKDYVLLKSSEDWFSNRLLETRTWLKNILDKYIHGDKELAVAKAILLGDKAALSHDIKSEYANTGAMHVLAVSGLHVGLISLFLLKTFNLFESKRLSIRIIKAMVLIGIIWIYAFICGGTPSVIRASCMYSFMFLGIQLFKKGNIFNTISLSAFLILLYDPLLLYDLSFQLSYTALIGIVYFQPKVYGLWIPYNPAVDWAWKLISVSIAAQITTLPLSIYYFHQMPLLFWLSGLVVIPAAFLILLLGMILFISNAITDLVSPYIALVLEKILWLNNTLINALNNIPFHKLNYISLQMHELILSYALIILIFFTIELKSGKALFTSLTVFLILLLSMNTSIFDLNKKSQLVIYHSRKACIMDVYKGRKVYSLHQRDLDANEVDFCTKGMRSRKKIKSVSKIVEAGTTKEFYYHKGLLLVNNTSVLNLNEHKLTDKILEVDFLLLSNDVMVDWNRLKEKVKFRRLVLSACNSYNYTKEIRKIFRNDLTKIHDIKKQGALIIDI